MNKRTLLSALMGISLAICVGATLMLITRQNVHDAETLLGEKPGTSPPAEATGADATTGAGDATEGEGTETTATTGATDSTEAASPKNGEIVGGLYGADEEVRTFNTGVNEVLESESFSDAPEGSVVGAYRVTLHEQALNWSQKANIPNVGDIIRVKVLPGIVYLMEVSSKTQSDDPEWTVAITGNLIDRSGYGTVSLLNGKMHIKIFDPSNNRIYILYYDREKGKDASNNDLYIVQELDTSLDAGPTYTPPVNPFDSLPGATDVVEPDFDDVMTPIPPRNTETPAKADSEEKSLN